MSDDEFYPMPLFVQLTVADIAASTDWYRAIGFESSYELPVMAHVRYRRYADVMLVDASADVGRSAPPADSRGAGVVIYLTVEDESVDDVAARAEAHGADVVRGPTETTWNTREVALRDPDGYELVFSEAVDTGRRFADVMGEDSSAE